MRRRILTTCVHSSRHKTLTSYNIRVLTKKRHHARTGNRQTDFNASFSLSKIDWQNSSDSPSFARVSTLKLFRNFFPAKPVNLKIGHSTMLRKTSISRQCLYQWLERKKTVVIFLPAYFAKTEGTNRQLYIVVQDDERCLVWRNIS